MLMRIKGGSCPACHTPFPANGNIHYLHTRPVAAFLKNCCKRARHCPLLQFPCGGGGRSFDTRFISPPGVGWVCGVPHNIIEQSKPSPETLKLELVRGISTGPFIEPVQMNRLASADRTHLIDQMGGMSTFASGRH